ncbi:S26 family signal peptidase [Natronomonas sp. EA1]|uniref:S26 family signal peptidase n=1 Tax=Natronomonas sp. EA1 TaxID=3421655 RepID=UPI003EB95425
MDDRDDRRGVRETLRWLWTTDHGVVLYVREVATSVASVLALGLLLFAISGVWPPMVAVESSSMYPHMQTGDLIFVMEEHRLSPEFAVAETGVVTYQVGENQGYTKFKEPGDVIIYTRNDRAGTTPIIHRAMLWVEEGENWYDRANPAYLGSANNCDQLRYCPAPHAGFITKGDNAQTNPQYDQVNGLSAPVKPSWVVGTAEARIPGLGFVKLCSSGGPCPLFIATGPPAPPAVMEAAAAPQAEPTVTATNTTNATAAV